jgi:hypothetical protein
MFQVRTAAASAFAGVALSIAPLGTLAQTTDEGSAVVKSITSCREITDEAQRFKCYDRVAGAIGKGEAAINQATKPPSTEEKREAERRKFGKTASPPAIVQATPKPRPAETRRPVQAEVNQIVGKLEHISLTSDGRLLIVTAADGTWVQTDHEHFQNLPRAGSQIMIRRSPLGNFMCDLDRWHAARCRRLD